MKSRELMILDIARLNQRTSWCGGHDTYQSFANGPLFYAITIKGLASSTAATRWKQQAVFNKSVHDFLTKGLEIYNSKEKKQTNQRYVSLHDAMDWMDDLSRIKDEATNVLFAGCDTGAFGFTVLTMSCAKMVSGTTISQSGHSNAVCFAGWPSSFYTWSQCWWIVAAGCLIPQGVGCDKMHSWKQFATTPTEQWHRHAGNAILAWHKKEISEIL